jgi:ribosome-associated heat shock protein Hsp15
VPNEFLKPLEPHRLYVVSKEARIDKWLWAVRLYKTRSLAAEACRDGHVLVNGRRVKPSREVHAGELVTAKTGSVQRTMKVISFPRSRVSARLVPEFLEDLTPASEYEKPRDYVPPPQFQWSKGLGRPTKKSRRLWEKLGPDDAQ